MHAILYKSLNPLALLACAFSFACAVSAQTVPGNDFQFIQHSFENHPRDLQRSASAERDATVDVAEAGEPNDGGLSNLPSRWDSGDAAKTAKELILSVKVGVITEASIDHKKFQPLDRDSTAAESPADGGYDPIESDESIPASNKFHWGPALRQSMILLGIQHGYAVVAQEKTRRAIANGNFFGDYWRAVKGIQGWDDGNRFATNYIAHPMQGALTGFIFAQNHERLKRQKFGESKQYWNDRFKALLWSTAWSTQFELGPISQSSIGNVGMYGHMGYVDLVITPTVGTGWMVAEEAVDRYVIRHIESSSLFVRMMARMFLNPMRTIANLLRFKEPWYRDRPIGH